MGLLDEERHLLTRELRAQDVRPRGGDAATGHHLDDVDAAVGAFPHRSGDGVPPLDLAAHVVAVAARARSAEGRMRGSWAPAPRHRGAAGRGARRRPSPGHRGRGRSSLRPPAGAAATPRPPATTPQASSPRRAPEHPSRCRRRGGRGCRRARGVPCRRGRALRRSPAGPAVPDPRRRSVPWSTTTVAGPGRNRSPSNSPAALIMSMPRAYSRRGQRSRLCSPLPRPHSGTGSAPLAPPGRHRSSRRPASRLPRSAPCRSSACAAYSEQLGVKRHTGRAVGADLTLVHPDRGDQPGREADRGSPRRCRWC